MQGGDGGEHRRVLDRLDGAGLVEQTIAVPLGQGSAEDVVDAGVVAEVERAPEPRRPERRREEHDQRGQPQLDCAPGAALRRLRHRCPSGRLMDMAEMNKRGEHRAQSEDGQRGAEGGPLRVRQREQVGLDPFHDDRRQDGEARQRQPQAHQESGLQREPAVEPAQEAIVVVEAPAPGVRLRVEPETEDLEPDHAENGGEDGGDTGRRTPSEPHQAQEHGDVEQEAQGQEHRAGDEEELVRRVEQHHPQAPPAVPKSAKLRLSFSGREHDRDLGRPESGEPGVDGELQIELHARAHRPDPLVRFPGERPEAAVHVGVARAEECVEDAGERRVAEPAVKGRDVARRRRRGSGSRSRRRCHLPAAPSRNSGIRVKS